MATIRPFHGLRYTSTAGHLSTLTAPPYDVLSPAQRDEYAGKNPHNIVMLTLPEQNEDDRSKFVKYARSSSRLAEWRRQDVLSVDEKPTLYRYVQYFQIPGGHGELVRTAVIALIKTEPYEKGVVLPHEQTFPKHKEDRLRILEATRTHLECIYGLFEDPVGEVHKLLSTSPTTPAADVVDPDGVRHVIELIDDAATCARIVAMMGDKKVWIADGHHRYETAVAFRQMQGERAGLIAEDFMMMALSSMADPGLVILPTHRIVKSIGKPIEQLKELFGQVFQVEEMPNSALLPAIAASAGTSARAFGVACKGGNGLVLKLSDARSALQHVSGDESERLKLLDVTILHKVIFEQLLGLSGLDFFSYTRDPEEALQAVDAGADASFLMNPPSVEDMRLIALGGEKMPQKSTYYFPKLLSGLVMWQLADFDEKA